MDQAAMKRDTVNDLADMYVDSKPEAPSTHTGGKPPIEQRKELLMFLWYIANTVTFRQLGNLFDTAKSTSWIAVNHVSSWLCSIGNHYVKWPNHNELKNISNGFASKKQIDHVLGTIDCTHVKIKAPISEVKSDCLDRNRSHSLVVHAICDHNKKIIDLHICG